MQHILLYHVTFTGHPETIGVAVTIAHLQRNLKVRRPIKFTENDKTVTVSASKGKVATLLREGNKLQNPLNRYWLIIQNFKIDQFLPYLNLKI